jgi:hypothetical protein
VVVAAFPGIFGIAPCGGANVLDIATPYPSTEAPALTTTQSGDIETIFHLNHQPQELRRYTGTDFRLEGWYKSAPTRKVTGLAFTPSANTASDATHVLEPWEVVVTWEDEATGIESLACDALVNGSTGFLRYPDSPQKYVWNTIEKAARYHLYAGQNGLRGYIGTVEQPAAVAGAYPTTVTFLDKGRVPVWSENAPTWDNPFQSDLSYPAAGCYQDDRLVVIGSLVAPSEVKASRPADYHNFDVPFLSDDNSPYDFNLTARRFEDPRWVVPLEQMLIGTSEALWGVSGSSSGSGAIDATDIFARARANRTCAPIQPVIVGNGIVYVQDGGQVVRYFKPTRDLLTEADPAVFGGIEITLRSGHLFETYPIVDMAYAQSPEPIIFFVRSDGALITLTAVPELGVWGWARHDTDGDTFESVTVVPDGTRDVPFFVVKRTINGATKRYLEYLAPRSSGVFLDCSTTKTQASSNVITGLSYLEAESVGVVADGTYRGAYTVSGGQVTFSGAAATVVTVGIPIQADWESLDFPQARDLVKTVTAVGVEFRSQAAYSDPAAGISLGPDSAHLSDIRKFSDARGETLVVPIDTGYAPGARCFVRHTQPYPLEIRGITREVEA